MDGAMKKYLAELIGTAVLVFVGCGAVIFSQFGGALPIGSFGQSRSAIVGSIPPMQLSGVGAYNSR